MPRSVLLAIYEHARAEFPAECCGYLVGPRDRPEAVDRVFPCTNAQASGVNPAAPDRGIETGFAIAGAELFRFAKSFDGNLPARVVYHSHTNGRAYFSEVDRAVAIADGRPAYPVQHLVVGVIASAVTEVAQFAWSDEASDFIEVARWKPE
jgi:proteasome lid subunit RPN8/RPN11